MFKQNKYTKWYNNIVLNAQNRSKDPSIYYESHHIVPQCMGGIETVLLTAREHFICHMLLTKMTDDRRMKYAAKAMTMHSEKRQLKISSHTYAYVKRIHAESVSERLKDQPKSDEHKENMSHALKQKWQDPVYRERAMKSKASTSQKIKELWKDPIWREKMLQARRK